MSYLALAELSLIFAAVIGWSVYEIISLRRHRRENQAGPMEEVGVDRGDPPVERP